jgi:hypothetical protein
LPWGTVGERKVTPLIDQGSSQLTGARLHAVDAAAKLDGERLLKIYLENPQQRPDHINYLRIMAKDGISGLLAALKDPNQILPVLVALGVSAEAAKTYSSSAGRESK